MSKAETKPSGIERYKLTFAGRELLKKYKLTDVGTWRVRGEDPNCDFGGTHIMPDLGTYEGKLEDIIAYAVTLPSFWTWGAGGDISKLTTVKIDAESSVKRVKLEQKIKELERQLKEARKELGEL